MINFCSDDDAVTFDFMMEEGWNVEILDHKAAIHKWRAHIRGAVNGNITNLLMSGRPYRWLIYWENEARPRFELSVSRLTTDEVFARLELDTEVPLSRIDRSTSLFGL